jgi:hypothetical protein
LLHFFAAGGLFFFVVRGCLIRFGTAVIELVEMTIYTICGGFDKLNHRIIYLLDIPDKGQAGE